jgi:hypothetical protein
MPDEFITAIWGYSVLNPEYRNANNIETKPNTALVFEDNGMSFRQSCMENF